MPARRWRTKNERNWEVVDNSERDPLGRIERSQVFYRPTLEDEFYPVGRRHHGVFIVVWNQRVDQ